MMTTSLLDSSIFSGFNLVFAIVLGFFFQPLSLLSEKKIKHIEAIF